MSLKSTIDLNNLPEHVAIVMDGNGRWAKKQGKLRVFGHQNGVKSVRNVTEAAAEIGVKYLTLYAFSTENWNRPKLEITALMELLVSTIKKETATLMKNNIRLAAIGDLNSLPAKCQNELLTAIEETKNNTRMTLVLALSYSSKWDITNAVKQISQKVKEGILDVNQINDNTITEHLSTSAIPNPELMIRTSGEYRISNFLLWELAYSELYFTETFYGFGKEEFMLQLLIFKKERRFGKLVNNYKNEI
ncbi:MAG: di-trans,poly-cis-decaprenylcistransferase [Bacteroidia bacterium]|nr:di-trans,poly-cis-decaprenylcistransferase [Bacteroidia bacterium]